MIVLEFKAKGKPTQFKNVLTVAQWSTNLYPLELMFVRVDLS